jgi:hypothetical protein
MPYAPSAFVPGPGRAMIGWQFYALGRRLETVALVANDAQGLAEAVGTLFEIVAGLEPLTPATLPATSHIAAASRPEPKPAEPAIAWQAVLPDRAVSIQADGGQIVVRSLDGSLTTLDPSGKIVAQRADAIPTVAAAKAIDVKTLPKAKMPANRLPKLMATVGASTAVGYWGGAVQVFDKDGGLKAERQLPQDIACLAWHGGKLIVGLADGKLVALESK